MRVPCPGLRELTTARLMSLGLVSGGAIALIGGIAAASPPASARIIRGCFVKNTGARRILIASETTCDATEGALDWNERDSAGVSGLHYLGRGNLASEIPS